VLAATVVVTASCARSTSGGGTGDDGRDQTPPPFGSDGSAPTEPCVNLQCKRVDCGSGMTTTIIGRVVTGAQVDPDPVYNAIVYIPNETPDPFQDNVICDHCGILASGKPVAAAVSGADGSFTLEDVPVGDNIPLVVQLGKWRRQTVIPTVTACKQNYIDTPLTRLPRNRAEGDIPRIAIATGYIDPIECVLRKMGIDDTEFTGANDQGRVHLYDDDGSKVPNTVPAASLWGSLDMLKRYDMVLLPCEGSEKLKTPEETQNMIDYTALGGRVMSSHYGYVWIARAQTPFPSTGDWNPNQAELDQPMSAAIDGTFPKGQAMADWLHFVKASDILGQIVIDEPRHDLGLPRNGSFRWIMAPTDSSIVLHMTFNTPIGVAPAMQCGRVVYSDFHVTPTEAYTTPPFPTECPEGPLLATERILEFMLFDLETCIQDDNEYPKPPPAR
jgi:hypothetical protein